MYTEKLVWLTHHETTQSNNVQAGSSYYSFFRRKYSFIKISKRLLRKNGNGLCVHLNSIVKVGSWKRVRNRFALRFGHFR